MDDRLPANRRTDVRLGRGAARQHGRARRRQQPGDCAHLLAGAGETRQRRLAGNPQRGGIADEQHGSCVQVAAGPIGGELQHGAGRDRVNRIAFDQVAAVGVPQRRERYTEQRSVRHDRQARAVRSWQLVLDRRDEDVVQRPPRPLASRRHRDLTFAAGRDRRSRARSRRRRERGQRSDQLVELRSSDFDARAANRPVRREHPDVHVICAHPIRQQRRVQPGRDRGQVAHGRWRGGCLAAQRRRTGARRGARHGRFAPPGEGGRGVAGAFELARRQSR